MEILTNIDNQLSYLLRVNDEAFKDYGNTLDGDKKYTELLPLKLFEIFTQAVTTFFVNAQSMLK